MMSAATLTRSWPALAAWGAGLIDIALGAGALRAGEPATTATGAILIVVGVAALVWGAVTLAQTRIVVPRAGVAGSLASVIVLAVTVGLSAGRASVIAASAAGLLLMTVGVFCALALRRERGAAHERASSSARRHGARTGIVGLALGAVAVAGLVTPALAATEAGILAPDHSEHSEMFSGGGHTGH